MTHTFAILWHNEIPDKKNHHTVAQDAFLKTVNRQVHALYVCVFGSISSIMKRVSPFKRAENKISEKADTEMTRTYFTTQLIVQGHISEIVDVVVVVVVVCLFVCLFVYLFI